MAHSTLKSHYTIDSCVCTVHTQTYTTYTLYKFTHVKLFSHRHRALINNIYYVNMTVEHDTNILTRQCVKRCFQINIT